MKPTDIVTVDPTDDNLFCDGGEYYGHPRVYLTLGDDSQTECYYCGRQFVAKKGDGTIDDSQQTRSSQ